MQHILVAEDDADLRDIVTIALTAAGHRVEVAADGEAALAMAIAQPPRLLISDLRMPILDGLQVIQALRGVESLAAIPAILYTAFSHSDPRVEVARALDGVVVVPKGRLHDLTDAVERILGEPSRA